MIPSPFLLCLSLDQGSYVTDVTDQDVKDQGILLTEITSQVSKLYQEL